MNLELPTRRATLRLAKALAAQLAPGDVVWLEGPLGAGKTFFARGLIRALGVRSVVPITSPTFSLMHEHEGRVPIRHLDLYRLGDAAEAGELGIPEAIEGSVAIVEWGARMREVIGERGIEIALAISERGRTASLRALDERGRAQLEALL
jgi:tRNA threonylcarbamoyladenosine biosynthesis protein TsaE